MDPSGGSIQRIEPTWPENSHSVEVPELISGQGLSGCRLFLGAEAENSWSEPRLQANAKVTLCRERQRQTDEGGDTPRISAEWQSNDLRVAKNIEWLAKELGISRQSLYRWHEESERAEVVV